MSTPNPPANTPQPTLPSKGPNKRRTGLWVTLGAIIVAAVVAAVIIIPITANGASDNKTVVKLGVTSASQSQWPVLKDILAKEGIDLQIVSFDSYDTPNPALADGQIDLNAFQHIDFLSNYNINTGKDLGVVGATFIVPLPIYSTKYTNVSEIPEGGKVAIPNDATNQARSLKVLAAAGLLTLNSSVVNPTPADVTSSKITVEPVDASLTASSLQDPQIAAAIVNNNFATDAGILGDVIYSVDPSNLTDASKPYVNVIASRSGDEKNPTYVKVWKAYHDPRVTKLVVKESGNTAKIIDEQPSVVQGWLDNLEAAKKASS